MVFYHKNELILSVVSSIQANHVCILTFPLMLTTRSFPSACMKR